MPIMIAFVFVHLLVFGFVSANTSISSLGNLKMVSKKGWKYFGLSFTACPNPSFCALPSLLDPKILEKSRYYLFLCLSYYLCTNFVFLVFLHLYIFLLGIFMRLLPYFAPYSIVFQHVYKALRHSSQSWASSPLASTP